MPRKFADEVREQLLAVDGVLVWVDPMIEAGARRCSIRCCVRLPRYGPWVSAHPDVILKMGVKEMLYRTRQLGWGTDTLSTARRPNSAPISIPGCNRRARAS